MNTSPKRAPQALHSCSPRCNRPPRANPNPEVPLDNNTAECVPRGPVVGRKNYYGSGAVWAGRLAAMMSSLVQTLTPWPIKPRWWLTAYLEAGALAGGKVPPNLARYLPWNLSEERRQEWCAKEGEAVVTDTS